MRRSTLTAIIVGLIVIVLGGLLYASRQGKTSQANPSPSPSNRPSAAISPTTSASPATSTQTIEVGGSTFNPATTTVTSGSTLVFKNISTHVVEVESDPHPVHTDNPELNIGQIKAGSSVSLVVTRQGHWEIHDHLNPPVKAVIIVK